MKKRTKTIVGIAVFLAAGTTAAAVLVPAARPDVPDGRFGPVRVVRGSIKVSVPTSGQFEPTTTTTVRPDPNLPQRQVTSVSVAVGDHVKAGDIVATVDSSGLDVNLAYAKANYLAQKARLDLYRKYTAKNNLVQAESTLSQARLDLESARASYTSTKELTDRGLSSQTALLSAERSLHSAEAAVEDAQSALAAEKSYKSEDELQQLLAAVAEAESTLRTARIVWDATKIRTPVSGVVTEVGVHVGDLVTATSVVTESDSGTSTVSSSSSICVVVDNDPSVLQALVDESDIAKVKVGQHAIVTPVAYPNDKLDGVVTSVSQTADTSSNVTTITAYISVANHDGRILSGMNADAQIITQQKANVLIVPSSAVKRQGPTGVVMLSRDGQVITQRVGVGLSSDGITEITSGLTAGETVLIDAKPPSASSNSTNSRGGGMPGLGGPPPMPGPMR